MPARESNAGQTATSETHATDTRPDTDEPSPGPDGPDDGQGRSRRRGPLGTLGAWMRSLAGQRNGDVREALEGLIDQEPGPDTQALEPGERRLLYNILNMRDMTAADVMVPRVDVVAVPEDAGLSGLVQSVLNQAHSRLPVYRSNLDDILGMVHVKDLVPYLAPERSFAMRDVLRPVQFVAPSMGLLELLLEMRQQRCHMALIVDEFGGIDGLVTIEDVVEEIVGEIQDEHETVNDEPSLVREAPGLYLGDARYRLDEVERRFGTLFSDEEREAADTLGGLAVLLAGRVPDQGETIAHEGSGIAVEILEGDPRRIRTLRLHNVPEPAPDPAAGG